MGTPKAKKGQKGFTKVEKVSVRCTQCGKNKKVLPYLAAKFKWCSNQCKGDSMRNKKAHNRLPVDKLVYVPCSLPGCTSGKRMLPCRWKQIQKKNTKSFCCREHRNLFMKKTFHEEFKTEQIKQENKQSLIKIWGAN